MVHSLLSANDWGNLFVEQLCQEVVKESLKSVPLSKSITYEVSSPDIFLDSDQAHYITIILNELVTNTIKYALPNRKTTHIRISITHQDGAIQLVYCDDGPGYPESLLNGDVSKRSIGYNLIFGIAESSLEGKVKIFNKEGAVTNILFPESAFDQ